MQAIAFNEYVEAETVTPFVFLCVGTNKKRFRSRPGPRKGSLALELSHRIVGVSSNKQGAFGAD
jgi:hypothetical protein